MDECEIVVLSFLLITDLERAGKKSTECDLEFSDGCPRSVPNARNEEEILEEWHLLGCYAVWLL
jgi:hypothetical protein